MISHDEAREVAGILIGVADPIRMKIVQALLDGPQCVGDIAKVLELPMVNTSHHLKVMRQSGILEHEKLGRRVLYSLNRKVHTAMKGPDLTASFKLGIWELFLRKAPRS